MPTWSRSAATKWVPVKRPEEPGDKAEEQVEAAPIKEVTGGEKSGKKTGKTEASEGKAEAKAGEGKTEAKGGEPKGSNKGGKGKGGDSKRGKKSEPKGGKGGESKGGAPKAEAKGFDKGTSKGSDRDAGKACAKGGGFSPKGDAGTKGAKGDAKGEGKDGMKGKGKDNWKGKGKGKDVPALYVEQPGAKTVQQVEDEIKTRASATSNRRPKTDAYSKKPIDAKGSHCEVHKHSSMGCAVISMDSAAMREEVMKFVERKSGPGGSTKLDINGVTVQLRRHKDKTSGNEVYTDIFAAWGHRAEKDTPLSGSDIAEAFDRVYEQAQQEQAQTAQGTLGAPANTTLSTVPQQIQRQEFVPPPPAHYPAVGQVPAQQQPPNVAAQQQAQQAAMMQHAMMYDYFRQSAMYGNMYHPGGAMGQYGHPYYQQQPGMPPAGYAPVGAPSAGTAVAATPAQAVPTAMVGQASQPAPVGTDISAPPAAAPGAAGTAAGMPPGYAPSRPKTLPIINPNSGSALDVLGLANFEKRKPSNPLKIINPNSGEAVKI